MDTPDSQQPAPEEVQAPAESAPEGADGRGEPAQEDPKAQKRRERAESIKRKRALDRAAKEADPGKRLALLVKAGLVAPELAALPAPSPEPVPPPPPAPAAEQSPTPAPAVEPAPSNTSPNAAGPVAQPEQAQSTAPAPAAGSDADLAQFIAQLDVDQVSGLIVGAVDGTATQMLGPTVALGEPERALLTKALSPVLKKHATPDKMTPEDVLWGCCALVYGPRLLPIVVNKIREARARG